MKYIVPFVICLLASKAWAQDLRLAGVEYFTYPAVQVKDATDNRQASFQEFGVYMNFPYRLKNKKTILVNGFQYGQVQATSHNTDLGSKTTSHFHRITYNFTMIHQWNERWTVIGRLSPNLASDFKEKLNGSDFIMQGSVIISKKYNNQLTAGAGLVYSTRLGKPMLLPGLQLRYKKDRQTLNVFIPAFIDYAYRADDKGRLNIGGRVALNGANFNISAGNLTTGDEMDRLNYSRANIGPVANYQLTRMLQVEVFGGLSTARRYQFEDIHDNRYKYNSKSGGFFNIGLAITPPKKW